MGFDSGEKNKPTIVFVHGIGSSSATWQRVITELQAKADIRILSVDLLGFGASPKPNWVYYTPKDHARALAATLRRRRVRNCILVGHSLGALVAIEYAKRHPSRAVSLVLCSPPLYTEGEAKKWLPQRDDIYKKLYQQVRKRETSTLRLSDALSRRSLLNDGFSLNEETLPAFMKSLEASIEHQTASEDLRDLSVPTTILYGRLDPIVIGKNIRETSKDNPAIEVKIIVSGHEISKRYAQKLHTVILDHLRSSYGEAALFKSPESPYNRQ